MKWLLLGLSICIGLFTIYQIFSVEEQIPESSYVENFTPSGKELAYVDRTVDGDTIEVDIQGHKYKVRYVGMDTPETVDPHRPVGCYGHQASDRNKQLLTGKTIWLERDSSEVDKFGRLLRYVYLPLNGHVLFINDYLVRAGYARVKIMSPDTEYSLRLEQAEQQAKQQLLGLWQKC